MKSWVDDRAESPGRKFHDADLIGIPYRLILGTRGLKEGLVEIKERKSGRVLKVKKEEAVRRVSDVLQGGMPEGD